ncbi:hypothetical protein GCM10010168_76730 [Actinoplanes ianthinogenes]|uniref:Uncharacterized protein n=1 Tax=Actinoplanes ianthinogenes TaxID=122358 RepID=A0ABM7M9Q6_9ACTN|nr:hypothetical protein [Actinoplanes ianthinogenes]BCJ48401.1 hypothetical protein Aiant_90580 [Actinoplanes ianthinogenes]GGR46640.1 hypothetical protein GCM10010168_76730 [Actinoplanes ianthinogenes]
MPELIAAVDTTVLVDHGTFDLLDDGGPQQAGAVAGDRARWLAAGSNLVTVHSAAGWDHVAGLRVEVWSGPPAWRAGWADHRDALVRFDSGLVEINPLVEAGDDEEALDLAPGSYAVRAYVAGRDDLLAVHHDPDTDLDGIERFLIQFWPAAQ